jgi:hypothetical protein
MENIGGQNMTRLLYMIIEPHIGIAIGIRRAYVIENIKNIKQTLPNRDISFTHINPHHVIINQCQYTSFIITKKYHNDTM